MGNIDSEMLKANAKIVEKHNLKTLDKIYSFNQFESNGFRFPRELADNMIHCTNDEMSLISFFTREIANNTDSRNGKNMLASLIKIQWMHFYCILTDSDPFESCQEISEKMFIPSYSDNKGVSYYGQGASISGLAATPINLRSMIVGSLINNQWKYCLAKEQQGLSYPRIDVTSILEPIIHKIFESKLEGFRNCFIIPIHIADTNRLTLLHPSHCNQINRLFGEKLSESVNFFLYKNCVLSSDENAVFENKSKQLVLKPSAQVKDEMFCLTKKSWKFDKVTCETIFGKDTKVKALIDGMLVIEVDTNYKNKHGKNISLRKTITQRKSRQQLCARESEKDAGEVSGFIGEEEKYCTSVYAPCMNKIENIARFQDQPIYIEKTYSRYLDALNIPYRVKSSSQNEIEGYEILKNFKDNVDLEEIKNNSQTYRPELRIKLIINKVHSIQSFDKSINITKPSTSEISEVLGEIGSCFCSKNTTKLENILDQICHYIRDVITEEERDFFKVLFNITEANQFEYTLDNLRELIEQKKGKLTIRKQNGETLKSISALDLENKSLEPIMCCLVDEKGENVNPNYYNFTQHDGYEVTIIDDVWFSLKVSQLHEKNKNGIKPIKATEYYTGCIPHRQMIVSKDQLDYVVLRLMDVKKNDHKSTHTKQEDDKDEPIKIKFQEMPERYFAIPDDASNYQLAPTINSRHPYAVLFHGYDPSDKIYQKLLVLLRNITVVSQQAISETERCLESIQLQFKRTLNDEEKNIIKIPLNLCGILAINSYVSSTKHIWDGLIEKLIERQNYYETNIESEKDENVKIEKLNSYKKYESERLLKLEPSSIEKVSSNLFT